MTLNSDNSLGWSGGTIVTGGTLKAGSANAFRPHTSFTLGNGADVVLDLNDFDFTFSVSL